MNLCFDEKSSVLLPCICVNFLLCNTSIAISVIVNTFSCKPLVYRARQRVSEAVKNGTAQIFGMNYLSSFAPNGLFGRSFSAALVVRFKRCQQTFFAYRFCFPNTDHEIVLRELEPALSYSFKRLRASMEIKILSWCASHDL